MSLVTRNKLGQGHHYKPLEAGGYSFHGLPATALRAKELLEIACATVSPKDRHAVMKKGFYADVSQCVSSKRWGPVVKSLCTSSLIYDVGRCRMLSGKHHLALLGFPLELDSESLSEPKRREMAGEAMFVPSIAIILLAIVVASCPAKSNKRARASSGE